VTAAIRAERTVVGPARVALRGGRRQRGQHRTHRRRPGAARVQDDVQLAGPARHAVPHGDLVAVLLAGRDQLDRIDRAAGRGEHRADRLGELADGADPFAVEELEGLQLDREPRVRHPGEHQRGRRDRGQDLAQPGGGEPVLAPVRTAASGSAVGAGAPVQHDVRSGTTSARCGRGRPWAAR
jgi:hypothetical protein